MIIAMNEATDMPDSLDPRLMRLHLPLVGATTADQGRDQIIIVTITVLLCSTRMAIISRPYATLRLKARARAR